MHYSLIESSSTIISCLTSNYGNMSISFKISSLNSSGTQAGNLINIFYTTL